MNKNVILIGQDLEEYGSGGYGIGFSFMDNENNACRVAIRLPNDLTLKDFKVAWKKLSDALEDPLNPKYRAKYSGEKLVGNEMEIYDEE